MEKLSGVTVLGFLSSSRRGIDCIASGGSWIRRFLVFVRSEIEYSVPLTMPTSWADSVEEAAPEATAAPRPTRPAYVPPHLRSKNPASADSFPARQSNEHSNSNSAAGFSRSGSRELGRPNYGRWERGGRAPREPNPFETADMLAELSVSEEEANGGGINFDAYEDIPVETSGSDVPPAVNSFAAIDLGDALNQNIKRCRYVKPTPVQRHAIPISMAGRDLMACAQTGSGKTAAFCFPIISGIMRNGPSAPQRGARGARTAHPQALILSPTRELSCQIHEEAKKFSYQTGVKVVVAYGGAPIHQQNRLFMREGEGDKDEELRDLERGVDILVATPGRLVDLVERARVSLHMIKYLALDEADRMLDMGFERQIRNIVERMDMPPPGIRQTMLFSATFPNEIQRLASDFMSNYIFLAVGRVGSSTDLISQRVEFVPEMEKRSHLMDLLHAQRDNGNCGKQKMPLKGISLSHSDGDQVPIWSITYAASNSCSILKEREQALRSFRSGITPILVATDVAARGLDIPHVSHVINFDLPKDIDDYVHRIGRTGRAGKSGLATAFFSEVNYPLAKSLSELMQEANQEVPSWLTRCAEKSYHGGGRNRRSGGGRFAGYDYRRDAPPRSGNSYHNSYSSGGGSYNYGSSTSGAHNTLAGGSGAYSSYPSYPKAGDAHPSHGYEFGHESIVATGWD
ncbi:DEAD-box ATP-dependent RNA helicase 37 [Asimina triloba]